MRSEAMTALRELAERWKAESGQGDWRRASTYANELLSILDAELVRSGGVSDEDVRDAERLMGIKDLCGYIQNGSDTVVRILQDDATGTWICEVGEKNYWASNFRAAIDTAIKSQGESNV